MTAEWIEKAKAWVGRKVVKGGVDPGGVGVRNPDADATGVAGPSSGGGGDDEDWDWRWGKEGELDFSFGDVSP